MSENLNAMTNCPVCGKENKKEGKFCQSCGANMVTSDFQPFEISQTMRARKNCFSFCCIIFIGIVFYFSLVVAPSVWPAFQAAVVAGLFIVLVGGVSIIGLLYILWVYRGSGVRRIFSISPKGIKIVVPRQPIFEVNWSEFDLIQMYKHAGYHNNNEYRFYFVLNDEVYKEFNIEGSMHFSGLNCRAIVSKMEQYAVKMNKQFVRGRRRKKKY
ncbi:MAG: hypothetical protein KGD58_14310 [Candidatus Lokiarchaeota archaeon]|nr:hypothetical protein [Candidatus Lokiarchaeota archaeon]